VKAEETTVAERRLTIPEIAKLRRGSEVLTRKMAKDGLFGPGIIVETRNYPGFALSAVEAALGRRFTEEEIQIATSAPGTQVSKARRADALRTSVIRRHERQSVVKVRDAEWIEYLRTLGLELSPPPSALGGI
jgi:hypothetical protein